MNQTTALDSLPDSAGTWLHGMERRLDLAVVVPTFDERENIPVLIAALREALSDLQWEVIFVDDDSPDGTAETIHEVAGRDETIRLIRRIGRRGLSSACIEGALATSASVIAVIDADMQHDERMLPRMLAKLRGEGLDVVVGTRNAQGGSMGDLSSGRRLLSRVGQRLSRGVCRCELSDPMSGFFLFRRSFFLEVAPRLHGGGFKILVDMLASSERPVRLAEMGYRFRGRLHGDSKLDLSSGIELLFLVANKLTGNAVPARFEIFALVGAAAIVLGWVWNYTVSSLFTWQTPRASAGLQAAKLSAPDAETYH